MAQPIPAARLAWQSVQVSIGKLMSDPLCAAMVLAKLRTEVCNTHPIQTKQQKV